MLFILFNKMTFILIFKRILLWNYFLIFLDFDSGHLICKENFFLYLLFWVRFKGGFPKILMIYFFCVLVKFLYPKALFQKKRIQNLIQKIKDQTKGTYENNENSTINCSKHWFFVFRNQFLFLKEVAYRENTWSFPMVE